MYISSIAITFSSENENCLLTTSISLDYVVGCTIPHAMEFVLKNPMVKSYLRRGYCIIGLNLKYSDL